MNLGQGFSFNFLKVKNVEEFFMKKTQNDDDDDEDVYKDSARA